MTYYRLEFLPAHADGAAKRFRSPEKAEKYARRVLQLAEDSDLDSRVAIIAVSKDEIQS
jgi:hypothetical protein